MTEEVELGEELHCIMIRIRIVELRRSSEELEIVVRQEKTAPSTSHHNSKLLRFFQRIDTVSLMKYHISPNLIVTIGVSLLVLALLLFSLATKMYNSYRLETFIEKFQAENERIYQENEEIQEEYQYVLSEEFQEKYAKENLGKMHPEEKMIVFTPRAESEELVQTQLQTQEEQLLQSKNIPPKQQWIQYFFGKRFF